MIARRPMLRDQAREALLEQLRRNGFAPGDFLPGEHALARTLTVSRDTVRTVLQDLRQEGLVQPVNGQGWRVCQRHKAVPRHIAVLSYVSPQTTSSFMDACLRRFQHPGWPTSLVNLAAQAKEAASLLPLSGMDGYIAFSGNPLPPAHLSILQATGSPLVGAALQDHQPYHTVATDNGAMMRLAVEALSARGHRQALLLGTAIPDSSFAIRQRAFHDLARKAGIKVIDLTLKLNWISREEDRPRILETLREHPGITAAVTVNETLARQLLTVLDMAGLRIPQDISLIGVGDPLPTADLQLHGIRNCILARHPWGDIAAIAASLLEEALGGGSPSPARLQLLPPIPLEIDSLAAPRPGRPASHPRRPKRKTETAPSKSPHPHHQEARP